ncbi:MAG: hypothetical protein ACK40O_00815 [Allosphingosinicella sp.]
MDLAITPADVVAEPGASIEHGTAGAAVQAGQVVYRDPADLKYKLADNNSATVAVRSPRAIALNNAANGQPLAVCRGGNVALGAVLAAGVAYYLSDTPGGICPVADLAAGEYPSIIGIAESASVLRVKIHEAGVALA